MLEPITFARNEDGSVKTKQACQTPGCKFPNWHLCSGPKAIRPPEPDINNAPVKAQNFEEKFESDPGKRERIIREQRERNQIRIAAENLLNRKRDEMIVHDRRQGFTQEALAKKYKTKVNVVRRVLKRIDEFPET